MNSKPLHLCFVGNMLGRNPGYITTQGQIIADLFAAEEGYEITCVSSKINRVARLWEIVTTLIKEKGSIDIVVLEVYSGLNLIIADTVGLLCKVFKIPLVMVLHGGKLPEFIERFPHWTRRVLKRTNFLVAPSRFLAEKIGNDNFNIRVIPNVIDLENYPFRLREKIQPRLVWMRSFHPIYNPQMAIEVLAELRRSEPAATLTMAGVDKGTESEIKKKAHRLNLADAVRFAGFLDGERKIQELSGADIYLNTNLFDNMPVSVVEACALGLPVIATRVGGVPYLISEGADGLLVESGNVREMTDAVKLLLKNPALTGKISRGARRLAECSAWTSVKKEWKKLFDEVLGCSPVRTANAASATLAENNFKTEKLGLR